MEPSVVYVGFKKVVLEDVFESKFWISKWCSHFGSTLVLLWILDKSESYLKHANKMISDFFFLLFVGMVIQLPWR